jgi:DNA-binding LacI/PurR family transcriptional regulator
VSIVGFDGHDLAPLFDLTTVDQHVSEQGRVAATLLLEVIETRDGAAERAHVELPTQLVIRGSSARRAGAEPAPVEARAPARRSRRPKALSP